MALKPCRECKKEISSDATVCPACGKKSPHGSSSIVVYGGGLLAALLGVYFVSGASDAAANRTMDSVHQQVVNDSIAQYRIAERGKDPIQTCVQAGFVVAAYLQAKDEANYQRWTEVKKQACAAAGMPE